MRFVLTAPDGGPVRFCVDSLIVLRATQETPNANAVVVTPLGNWAVTETPEQVWKLAK